MKHFTKYSPVFLGILLTLCACGKPASKAGTVYNSKDVQSISGTTLFSTDFCNSITEIIFHSFDETTISINDSAKIKSTLELLQANNYEPILDENSLKEGFYMIDLVTDNTTYSIGFASDSIAFDGNQYILTDSTVDLAATILEILGME